MFEGFRGFLMFQQEIEFFCMFAKKTIGFPSRWPTACDPDCEFVPRWPKNLKSPLWVLLVAIASFLKIWVSTVNSPVPASAWKKAVLNPLGFTSESATEKIPSFHWNCKPETIVILKVSTFVIIKILAIHVEIAFERVEEEIVVVEPPSFVFSNTVHNQRVVEPVGQISEAVPAVVIVDSDTRQPFPICDNRDRNFETAQNNVCC